MPSKQEDLGKAEENERFLSSIDVRDSCGKGWALVVCFYSALHYIEAYFATKSRHSPNHQIRDSEIRRDRNTLPIADSYSELKTFSMDARYDVVSFPASDVTDARHHLAQIKAHILALV